MWNFSNDVYISVCNEIEKNLEWTFNDHFDDEKFMAFNGESGGKLWMVKFYYELEAIGIIKSKNNEVEEEEIFEHNLNKNICEILNISYSNSDSNSTEETSINTSENSNSDLYEGKRKYTSITEDKFTKTKTITWNSWSTQPSYSSKQEASAQLGIIWYLDSFIGLVGVDEGLGMGMRLIENSKSRLVVIDYEYHGWDWWFLGRGSLSVLIDGDETISLTGKETRNKVYSSGKRW